MLSLNRMMLYVFGQLHMLLVCNIIAMFCPHGLLQARFTKLEL